ncbi:MULTISPECIES: MarR family winged helix-turn-helix transcriptional regulator [Neobacillus]|uniref:MarR family transcriptional regulator n=1 Tax=Neobacillus rhizophilus TaxID=2833579 RepID=A0A942YT40_9BACI|nr:MULTISPECIES: MarR family transcriptional regulator [Neobacillus]MBS4211497.1 MarR family transcriptional regulator [Neobacillus rhizophilus]MBU8916915.1 MarR family transcriptional regulator [Bacillus sp. FJAT-29953]
MDNNTIQDLIDRYVNISFQVHKKAEALIKNQLGNELTNDQHYILRYIHQTGECTSTELAEVFQVNKSAITAIINRMTDRGLIQRTRDEKDRRVVYLTPTQEGVELFQSAQEKVHQLVESIITQFDETEITTFINTYEKLAQILDNKKQEELGE